MAAVTDINLLLGTMRPVLALANLCMRLFMTSRTSIPLMRCASFGKMRVLPLSVRRFMQSGMVCRTMESFARLRCRYTRPLRRSDSLPSFPKLWPRWKFRAMRYQRSTMTISSYPPCSRRRRWMFFPLCLHVLRVIYERTANSLHQRLRWPGRGTTSQEPQP